MTKEELENEVKEIVNKKLCSKMMCYNHCSFNSPKHHRCGEWHRCYESAKEVAEPREKRIERLSKEVDDLENMKATLESRVAELEAQNEKLIDFVLSKTECCDVCPITDTCINSEGTCPYAGILAKGEEEVTREWLMQFISRG